MQNDKLTLKIEMFGNLIEELNYWNDSVNDEDEDGDLEYCEQKFLETLRAVRDLRIVLLVALDEYIDECKDTEVPIDLGYYRIKKQLDESTFELIRQTH